LFAAATVAFWVGPWPSSEGFSRVGSLGSSRLAWIGVATLRVTSVTELRVRAVAGFVSGSATGNLLLGGVRHRLVTIGVPGSSTTSVAAGSSPGAFVGCPGCPFFGVAIRFDQRTTVRFVGYHQRSTRRVTLGCPRTRGGATCEAFRSDPRGRTAGGSPPGGVVLGVSAPRGSTWRLARHEVS
jgi:hypothetical protein